MTTNVFRLVREPVRVELRAVLQRARDLQRPAQAAPVTMEIEGKPIKVTVYVHPATDRELEGYFLVMFHETESATEERTEEPGEAASSATFQELQAELAIQRQRLQAVIEEYETSREEMQASNEELQSANEELRSAMEELETSKEELQSMNEELTTLNQENRHRVEELSQLGTWL